LSLPLRISNQNFIKIDKDTRTAMSIKVSFYISTSNMVFVKKNKGDE
jgi:hypothetical protein